MILAASNGDKSKAVILCPDGEIDSGVFVH